jgi:hypothetical protein
MKDDRPHEGAQIPPPAPRVDRLEEGYRGAQNTGVWDAVDLLRESMLRFMARLFRVPYFPPASSDRNGSKGKH